MTSALVTPIVPTITVTACRMSAKTPNQLTARTTTHDVKVIAIVTGRSVCGCLGTGCHRLWPSSFLVALAPNWSPRRGQLIKAASTPQAGQALKCASRLSWDRYSDQAPRLFEHQLPDLFRHGSLSEQNFKAERVSQRPERLLFHVLYVGQRVVYCSVPITFATARQRTVIPSRRQHQVKPTLKHTASFYAPLIIQNGILPLPTARSPQSAALQD